MSGAVVMPGRRRFAWMRRAGLVAGAIIVGLVLLVAILAPWITPHDPFAQNLDNRLSRAVLDGGHASPASCWAPTGSAGTTSPG